MKMFGTFYYIIVRNIYIRRGNDIMTKIVIYEKEHNKNREYKK